MEPKTCLMLGDSIVWYDGHETLSGPKAIQRGYPAYLREMGFDRVDNAGISGACWADRAEPEREAVPLTARRYDFSLYDAVIVAAGINDFHRASPLGRLTDEGFDLATVGGALSAVCVKARRQRPRGGLLLLTPRWCADGDTKNAANLQLDDYAALIEAAGRRFGVPTLNLTRLEGYRLDTMTLDGLHPNNAGYAFVCRHARWQAAVQKLLNS